MSTDDPRLRRALDDAMYRETLATSSDPLAVFLRRAGAFFAAMHEEIDFTDWNGAIVGRGAGAEIRAAIPPDPRVPFVELAPLLDMGAFARELVARHPSTPVSTLLALADDPKFCVQCGVVERAANDETVLERLRQSRFGEIRARSGGKPAPNVETADQVRALAEHFDESVRHNVAHRRSLPADVLEQLAADASVDVRQAIAGRRDITPAALARIVEHELAPRIVAALAANPAVPGTILERFMDDRSPYVRLALAENPSFTQLPLLATDPFTSVREAIAARTDAPREVLEMLARDDHAGVRNQAADTLGALAAPKG